VEPVRVDLAGVDGVEGLYGKVKACGRPLDAAALNAGIGAGGSFVETRAEAD
jgi:short-subunit dehydrogenase